MRRNVFHALLYSFTLSMPAIRRAAATRNLSGLLRCLNELLTFTARVASCNQRTCLGLPALRLGRGSTLLESQEVAWLGWNALCVYAVFWTLTRAYFTLIQSFIEFSERVHNLLPS